MVSVSLRVSELSVGIENAGSKCACPSPTGIPRAWAGEMTLSLSGVRIMTLPGQQERTHPSTYLTIYQSTERVLHLSIIHGPSSEE